MNKIDYTNIRNKIELKQSLLEKDIDRNNLKEVLQELDIFYAELLAQNEELIEKEQILIDSNQEYQLLFFDAPIIYLLVDKNFTILQYNRKADEYFRFSVNATLKRTFFSTFEISYLQSFLDWANKERYLESPFELDIKYDKKEVKRFKLYATKYPLNEEHLLFSLVDINDEYILKKNLEEEVKIKSEENLKQYQILQQRSKFAAMGEMIANIAHQWRQPINALSAYNLNIVIKYNKQALNDQIIEEFSNKSQMLINKMNSLITSFSNFFEPDKVKNRFNIKDSIYEALSLLEDTLALNKIKVNINCKTDIYLDGYKNEFEQIILNILNNSKDAFISKNKEGEITITISNNIIEEYLNIEIIDNAGGIEEDIVTRIFEPYFTTKEKDEGTGIGLYMCKVIIEQSMHGKIDMINFEDGVKTTINIPQ